MRDQNQPTTVQGVADQASRKHDVHLRLRFHEHEELLQRLSSLSHEVTMKSAQVLSVVVSFIGIFSLAHAQLSNVTTPSLNLTAIAASNGSSVLECWQFPGFAASAQAGTSGALNLFLGDTANASYTIIPARFNGGVHTAPTAQFVYFASGLAHVTLPNTTESSTTSTWIQGGKYGLIVAVDTPDISRYGHITTYPSDADTVTLQVPFAKGSVPKHIVIHNGPCGWEDTVGI